MLKVRMLSIFQYTQTALTQAVYEPDEHDMIVAYVPGVSGFFSQGETFEEARENLRDAIEGNVTLALQMGLPIPALEGVLIEEQHVSLEAA